MDIFITETGNGGDVQVNGTDLALVFSFENMPYLALFGGNKAATTTQRIAGEQAFDFWGNSLVFSNTPDLQLNSLTEKALDTIPLTSKGRLQIEEAIKADLAFMRPFAEVTVQTAIIATDQLQIDIIIRRPDNLQEKKYIYIWDAGRLRVLPDEYRPVVVSPFADSLQYELQFYL